MTMRLPLQRGFTLLEIMIALAIFSVISILAWQILDGAIRTSTASDIAAARLTQLQRAYNLLERDFFQLQARPPRNSSDVFTQDKDAVDLTTLNGMSGQVQLERVRWQLKEKRLWRNVWPAIDGPAGVQPEEVPILSGVKEAKWRFWSEGWKAQWDDMNHQPDGAELTLTMEDGETWRWVFLTPGDVPEMQTSQQETGAEAMPQSSQAVGFAPTPNEAKP